MFEWQRAITKTRTHTAVTAYYCGVEQNTSRQEKFFIWFSGKRKYLNQTQYLQYWQGRSQSSEPFLEYFRNAKRYNYEYLRDVMMLLKDNYLCCVTDNDDHNWTIWSTKLTMHTTMFNVALNFCFGGNHQLRKPWSEGRNTIRKI